MTDRWGTIIIEVVAVEEVTEAEDAVADVVPAEIVISGTDRITNIKIMLARIMCRYVLHDTEAQIIIANYDHLVYNDVNNMGISLMNLMEIK